MLVGRPPCSGVTAGAGWQDSTAKCHRPSAHPAHFNATAYTADITVIDDAKGLPASGDLNNQRLADGSDIAGATGKSCSQAAADAGRANWVRISFTDDGRNAESLTSAATAAVATEPLTAEVPARPHQSRSYSGADDSPQIIAASARRYPASRRRRPRYR